MLRSVSTSVTTDTSRLNGSRCGSCTAYRRDTNADQLHRTYMSCYTPITVLVRLKMSKQATEGDSLLCITLLKLNKSEYCQLAALYLAPVVAVSACSAYGFRTRLKGDRAGPLLKPGGELRQCKASRAEQALKQAGRTYKRILLISWRCSAALLSFCPTPPLPSDFPRLQ